MPGPHYPGSRQNGATVGGSVVTGNTHVTRLALTLRLSMDLELSGAEMSVRVVLMVLAALALMACGGGDATSPLHGPSVHEVGSIATDTVLAVPSDLLRVEVRDSSGQIARGVLVQFRVPNAPGHTDLVMQGAWVCDAGKAACGTFTPTSGSVSSGADAYTDNSGVAAARFQHGELATSGIVQVAVPALNVTISVPYTTSPGPLVGFSMSEADTSVYVGKSYTLTAKPADRFGNVRTEAVTIAALTPNIATFNNGEVRAVALGRGSFSVSAAGFVQNAFVSVPPPGRLVVGDATTLPALGIVLLNTDGAARRSITTTKGHVGYAWPGWYLDDSHVSVWETSAEGQPRIILYDTASSARTALVDTIAYPQSLEPSYVGSAQQVYFNGKSAAGQYGFYRANADGSTVQLVIPDAICVISPDGNSVLLLAQNHIVNRNLATRQDVTVALTNYTPFWSPAGDLIGYVVLNSSNTLDLHVVRPDGTGDRLLSAGISDARSFSPDGQWIATTRGGVGVELVRVSDGLRLPVGGTRNVSQVAWRRE